MLDALKVETHPTYRSQHPLKSWYVKKEGFIIPITFRYFFHPRLENLLLILNIYIYIYYIYHYYKLLNYKSWSKQKLHKNKTNNFALSLKSAIRLNLIGSSNYRKLNVNHSVNWIWKHLCNLGLLVGFFCGFWSWIWYLNQFPVQ